MTPMEPHDLLMSIHKNENATLDTDMDEVSDEESNESTSQLISSSLSSVLMTQPKANLSSSFIASEKAKGMIVTQW